MRIETSDGKPLRSMADWQAVHNPEKWKPGRSAHAIADFIVNRDGARVLSRRVSAILGERAGFRKIIPEHKVAFDQYSNPRVHDLGIYGETESGKTLFVGLEAKVDEKFGEYVSVEWQNADTPSKRGRITQLCDRFQNVPGISEYDEVRYQLVYAVAGTVDAGADLSILYIAVFATDDYDPAKGESNRQDYRTFITRAGGTAIPNPYSESHNLNIGGKPLTAIYETFNSRAKPALT